MEIQDDRIYIVEECCVLDLERVIQDRSVALPLADIKSYISMLLRGLAHCHTYGIIHRVRCVRELRCSSTRVAARASSSAHPIHSRPYPLSTPPMRHANAACEQRARHTTSSVRTGFEAEQLAAVQQGTAETGGLWHGDARG